MRSLPWPPIRTKRRPGRGWADWDHLEAFYRCMGRCQPSQLAADEDHVELQAAIALCVPPTGQDGVDLEAQVPHPACRFFQQLFALVDRKDRSFYFHKGAPPQEMECSVFPVYE